MEKLYFLIAMSLAALTFNNACKSQVEEYPAEWIKFKDTQTGYEVWQITNDSHPSEAFYFYAPSFTADDRYVIFRSDRSGQTDVYRCELSSGEIARMTTEGVGAACIHPDGKSMVYIADWKYYRMDVHTMKKELVMDFTGKLAVAPKFRPWITNDGRYTIVFGTKNKISYLYRVDLQTKEILKVHQQDTGSFTHPFINPENPDLVSYNPTPFAGNDMSLPDEKRAKTRMIRLGQGSDEPFLVSPVGFTPPHPSWSRSGDRYFYFERTKPGYVPVSIKSIDKNGGDMITHYTSDSIKLGHGTVSVDGKWFISDSEQTVKNELMLINLQDGKAKLLCYPNATISNDVHVHPNFSSSGNYVIYTSDVAKKGLPQVYVMPVKQIKDNW